MEKQFQNIAELKASLIDLIERSNDVIKRSQEIIDQSDRASKRIWHLLAMKVNKPAK